MSKKVSDILPDTEILAQMAEKASKLALVALELRRALDGANPTPKSVKECRKAFEEEYADVVNCIIALDLDDAAFDRMRKMQHEKEIRWLSRLEAKENENAECHVICGLFGNIYAGTYAVPCKDDLQVWQSMKEVTSEAVEAVVNHFIIKMERDCKNKIQKAWGVRGGKTLKVTFELSTGKEWSDE